jgi:predicted transposase YdaD
VTFTTVQQTSLESSCRIDLATQLATTMVYENSGCTKDEIRAMHALVTQVSRAFFDPHFVILMDRMMTSDM